MFKHIVGSLLVSVGLLGGAAHGLEQQTSLASQGSNLQVSIAPQIMREPVQSKCAKNKHKKRVLKKCKVKKMPKAWYPSGFRLSPNSKNVAYRWSSDSEFECGYETSVGCWQVKVVSKTVCNIELEVGILNASDEELENNSGFWSHAKPGKIKIRTFDTWEEDATHATVNSLNCA